MHRREVASRNRTKLLGLVIAAGLCLPSCGGSSTTPTQVPQNTTTVFSDTFTGLPPNFGIPYDFTVSAAGSLEVILDWTHPTNNMALFLTTPSCTIEMLNANTCDLLAAGFGTKPKRIQRNALQPGTYRVWVANFGSTNESGVVNALLTR